MSQPPDQPDDSDATVVHPDADATVVHPDAGGSGPDVEPTAHIPNPTAPAQVYIPSTQTPSSDLHTARTQERGAFTPPSTPPASPLAPIYGKSPRQQADPAPTPWYQQPVARPQNPSVDPPPPAYGTPPAYGPAVSMPGAGVPGGYPVMPGAPADYPGGVPTQAGYPGGPVPQGWGYPVGLTEPPAKKSRKKWVVSGLIVLVIALAGGGAAAYFLYFSGARDRGAITTAATDFTRAAAAGDPAGVRGQLCEAEASALPELDLPAGAEVVQDSELQVAVNAIEVREDLASATVTNGGNPEVTMYFRRESGDWKVCSSAKDDFSAAK